MTDLMQPRLFSLSGEPSPRAIDRRTLEAEREITQLRDLEQHDGFRCVTDEGIWITIDGSSLFAEAESGRVRSLYAHRITPDAATPEGRARAILHWVQGSDGVSIEDIWFARGSTWGRGEDGASARRDGDVDARLQMSSTPMRTSVTNAGSLPRTADISSRA